jgi:hypothetical protein
MGGKNKISVSSIALRVIKRMGMVSDAMLGTGKIPLSTYELRALIDESRHDLDAMERRLRQSEVKAVDGDEVKANDPLERAEQ